MTHSVSSDSDPFEGIEGDRPAPLDPDPDAINEILGHAPPPPPAVASARAPNIEAPPKRSAAMAKEDGTRLVRIKPFNRKRRQLTRRYTVFGVKFEVEKGWYRVRKEVADYLRGVTTDGDPDSPPIFDVCTEAEALEIEEHERRRAIERAGIGPSGAMEPREMGDQGVERMKGVVTSDDLKYGYDSRRPHDTRRRTTFRE